MQYDLRRYKDQVWKKDIICDAIFDVQKIKIMLITFCNAIREGTSIMKIRYVKRTFVNAKFCCVYEVSAEAVRQEIEVVKR